MMRKLITHSSELLGKRQNLKTACLIIGFVIFMAGQSFAQAISSSELINRAKELDGSTVVFQGEAIGDIMRRGEFAWVNIHDGQNAIGIWAPLALVGKISYTGSYKTKGDIVEVAGIFHRACPEHGADLDIHAQELSINETGQPKTETIDLDKRNAAFVLLGVLVIIWILSLLKRK